jgi:hypothetical protein
MKQRTLKRLTVLALLVVSLAVMGLGFVTIAMHQARMSRQQALKPAAEQLQAILAKLRSSDNAAWKDAWQRFEGWMAINVVRGKTTEADFEACFGKASRNLDRPWRDNVRTIEYPLYGDTSGGRNLVLDFDSRKRILRDWQISEWVCGYCPHVLADDGRWRLEGKMLAGRLGMHRKGSDTLLLPRLLPRSQRLGIRLANWAAEMEYIDEVQLGVVPCEPGDEVDMDDEGQPYVWKAMRALEVGPIRQKGGRDAWTLSVGEPAAGRVIVLEVRNTGAFESAMREAVFRQGAPWPPASLALDFDDRICRELQPVGTKFLRRIVVPVPPDVCTLRIGALASMWLVRRAWLGQGQVAQDAAWLFATEASSLKVDALRLLRYRDEDHLVLAPMQEVDLRFMAPETGSEKRDRRFILRMWGYYELLPMAGPASRERASHPARER